MGTDNLHQSTRTKIVNVSLESRGLSRPGVGSSNHPHVFGTSTSAGSVTLTFNPFELYRAYGECQIIILLDDVHLPTESTIGELMQWPPIAPQPGFDPVVHTAGTVGHYRIYIAAIDARVINGEVEGLVFNRQEFSMYTPQSALGTIIVISIIALVIIVGLVFIRLRTRMRVK